MPYIPGAEAYKNERIAKAWEVSNKDKDFVLLLNAENGAWTHDSKHVLPYYLCWTWDSWSRGVLPNQNWCNSLDPSLKSSDGRARVWWRAHYDYGLCGMSDGYYKHLVDDERFNDLDWQLEQCYNVYKEGATFYGWAHRHKRGRNIIFP